MGKEGKKERINRRMGKEGKKGRINRRMGKEGKMLEKEKRE